MDLYQKWKKIYNVLTSLGIKYVYFEPPSNTKINYPCAIYKRGTISTRNADNGIYKLNDSFDLTYISRDPADEMVHTILIGDSTHEKPFQMIRHIRHYTVDGLHHDQYKIFI